MCARYAEIGGLETEAFNKLETAFLVHVDFSLNCAAQEYSMYEDEILRGGPKQFLSAHNSVGKPTTAAALGVTAEEREVSTGDHQCPNHSR